MHTDSISSSSHGGRCAIPQTSELTILTASGITSAKPYFRPGVEERKSRSRGPTTTSVSQKYGIMGARYDMHRHLSLDDVVEE
jgi:hypothetical protein